MAKGAVEDNVGEEGSWDEMVEGRLREMGWVARCSWRGAVEGGRRWGGWREACRSWYRKSSPFVVCCDGAWKALLAEEGRRGDAEKAPVTDSRGDHCSKAQRQF